MQARYSRVLRKWGLKKNKEHFYRLQWNWAKAIVKFWAKFSTCNRIPTATLCFGIGLNPDNQASFSLHVSDSQVPPVSLLYLHCWIGFHGSVSASIVCPVTSSKFASGAASSSSFTQISYGYRYTNKMYGGSGIHHNRDLEMEYQAQISTLRPRISARRANMTVKFQDLYGFTVEGNVDDVNVLNEVREKARQQGRVWWALEASKGPCWYLDAHVSSIPRSSLKFSAVVNAITLKRLIKKGIPLNLRPKVWFSISGASKKKSTVPDSYYNDLISAVDGKVTSATRQIDHDLPRTFPGHPWLDTPDGHAALRRVLVGYSFRDSDVGYCQGLNYVAALLLLVMKTEEDAFWMLSVLLEDVLANDCYTNNLCGCHVDQRVFRDLLTNKCPRIAAHLGIMEFDVSLVSTEWFICLFSKSLPTETTLRVWDILFYEGANVLFNVALAIFKMNEEELLITNQVGDVINVIQRSTHHLFDPDKLLTVALEKIGSMTTNTISKQRKKQEPAVMAELDQRLRRLNFENSEDK